MKTLSEDLSHIKPTLQRRATSRRWSNNSIQVREGETMFHSSRLCCAVLCCVSVLSRAYCK